MDTEHARKYEAIAHWLGIDALKALVPFSAKRIHDALAEGDEHLNSLSLASWEAQHGAPPGSKPKVCACCKQVILPTIDRNAGVWGLVRSAIRRDREAGREPLLRAWSLSDTICVLKHVARHHISNTNNLN